MGVFFFKYFQELSDLKDTNFCISFLIWGNYDHHESSRGHYGGSVFITDIDRHNSEKKPIFCEIYIESSH